jgi:MarR family transcriptional regulator, organic hydroperoxide resistance regulator
MNEFLSLWTRASKVMRAAVDDAMSRHGVRVGQNMILEVLWETDDLTPGELANRLHVATPTIVKSATRMEASGLLTRRRDPADARLVRLYLTKHARSVRTAIETERDALAQRATAALTAAERRALLSALTKIVEQFTDDAPSHAPDGDSR